MNAWERVVAWECVVQQGQRYRQVATGAVFTVMTVQRSDLDAHVEVTSAPFRCRKTICASALCGPEWERLGDVGKGGT